MPINIKVIFNFVHSGFIASSSMESMLYKDVLYGIFEE